VHDAIPAEALNCFSISDEFNGLRPPARMIDYRIRDRADIAGERQLEGRQFKHLIRLRGALRLMLLHTISSGAGRLMRIRLPLRVIQAQMPTSS
jgi:hypothetical protein